MVRMQSTENSRVFAIWYISFQSPFKKQATSFGGVHLNVWPQWRKESASVEPLALRDQREINAQLTPIKVQPSLAAKN